MYNRKVAGLALKYPLFINSFKKHKTYVTLQILVWCLIYGVLPADKQPLAFFLEK